MEIHPAAIPVVANVDARAVTEPGEIADRLLRQLTSPVRWVECVMELRESEAEVFYEPGPGSVLTGLLRRIDRDLEGRAIAEPDDFEEGGES
ncbi:MAG: hypothetical protein R3326_07260 [Gemmatimonadota bacterium]|nr:hypothetical protein [Gemmatimonadota bacterium]